MKTLAIGAALLVLAGCTHADNSAGATASDPVMKAAATAKAIEGRPAAADSILTAAGYTRDSFQQLMYEIAADSAKSAAFAAAKGS